MVVFNDNYYESLPRIQKNKGYYLKIYIKKEDLSRKLLKFNHKTHTIMGAK